MGDPAVTYLEASGSAVEAAEAEVAWVAIARESLLRTASTYNAVVTYGDLAEELQHESGIRTRRLTHRWLGDVLGVVGHDCHQLHEPLLSSLCVLKSGAVGAGYGPMLDAIYGGPRPEDLDLAAAEERLKCYRHFGAELPADGGRPTLAPQLAASRRRAVASTRARSAAGDERAVCPSCHVQLPWSGVCGSHD